MNTKFCYTFVVYLFYILISVQGDSIKSKSINCNTNDAPNECNQNANVLPKIVSLIDIPGILNKTLGSSADKNIQITAVNIGSDKNHHENLLKKVSNSAYHSDVEPVNPTKNHHSHETYVDSNESQYKQYPHHNHYPYNPYHHYQKESQHSGEANIQITSVNIENADPGHNHYSHHYSPGPNNITSNTPIPTIPTRPHCPANEEYRGCGTKCQATCDTIYTAYCVPDCVAGCFCKQGYVRKTPNGPCVKISRCPSEQICDKNEVYSECASACPKTCDNIDHYDNIKCFWDKCLKGCRCKSGYVRDRRGKCILPSKCPDNNNGGCHHGYGGNGGHGQSSNEHHGYENNNYGNGNHGHGNDNYGGQGSYEQHGNSNNGQSGSKYGYSGNGNNGHYGNTNQGSGHGHSDYNSGNQGYVYGHGHSDYNNGNQGSNYNDKYNNNNNKPHY